MMDANSKEAADFSLSMKLKSQSEIMESALACLRHAHDRLTDYPEFETLQATINAECRALSACLKATER